MTEEVSGPGSMADVVCPRCATVGSLAWHWIFVGKPIGTFSLSGQTMKVGAVQAIEVTCSVCPLVMRGIPGGDIIRVDDRKVQDGNDQV